MGFFDLFNTKKIVEPLAVSTDKNTEALHALVLQVTDQFTQTQSELQALSARTQESFQELSSQTQKSFQELSMQTEEVYDCVSDADTASEDDISLLVDTIIALRDHIEHLREYSLARNDGELLHQVDLLTLVCDRNLSEAGIRKINRKGQTYDGKMDIVAEVAYEPDALPNQNLKALSGCYEYRGEIVKRASVIINK